MVKKMEARIFKLATILVVVATFCCLTDDKTVYATASTINISVADNISLNIVPSVNGDFASSNTTAPVIAVATNHFNGYTLGIKATQADGALVNTTDNTKTIPSISASLSEQDFRSSSDYNNSYGYRPSKYNSTANTNYLPVPTNTETPDILDVTSVANSDAANEYNIAIGARVDETIATGTYSNTFVITVVANPTPYSITYNANTTDQVSNMPENIDNASTYDTHVNISDTIPSRSGFGFKGWCTEQTTDNGTCAGTTYNPNGSGSDLSWELDQTINNNHLTLYAIWGVSASSCENGSRELYCLVEDMSQGTQAVADLNEEITTSNSGVFKYDSSAFGAPSDSSGDYDIYYYRGILDSNMDSTTSTYGSRGDGVTWPNYVRLGNTCWRIIRTTGSGGTKMIYNGLFGDTSSGTCANATSKAQTRYNNAELKIEYNTNTTSKAGKTYTGLNNAIHAVGFTYSGVGSGSGFSSANNLFGASGDDTTTNTNSSVIKKYIDDWYSTNINGYTSLLETNAGYCNDRTLNTSTTWTTPTAGNTSIQIYKATGATEYYFGPYVRNISNVRTPTLTCDRGTVDTYSTTTDDGGNGQLTNPIALITADEATLAGSGTFEPSEGPTYSFNSFIHSKYQFWTMSPADRAGHSSAVFILGNEGKLLSTATNFTPYGVRPVVSLKQGVEISSGTGTATNPWIITAP